MQEKLNLPPSWHGSVWQYQNQSGENSRHHHAELEFNLVTAGTGNYLLENRKYRVMPGDMLWLFPKQEHVLVGQSPDFAMWVGVFTPATVRQLAQSAGYQELRKSNPPGEYCRRVSHEAMIQLDTIIARVAAAEERVAELNAGLHFLLLTLWHTFQQSGLIPVDDLHPAVERAARLIRDNPDKCTSLPEIARQAGLSPARLSRLFHLQTGMALVDYRNRVRIGCFVRIYGKGQQHNMLNAALTAGFGSYPQFHRVFKQVMGCSPTDYRRQARSSPELPKTRFMETG